MGREKRKGDIQIPDNLDEMLNEAQRQALRGVKCLGWEPQFLRRPLFAAPVLVLHSSNDGRIATIDENGKLRIHENIKVREQETQAQAPVPLKNLHFY